MADRRVPQDELGLEVFLSFDYHKDEFIHNIFQIAASQIEATLAAAQAEAQRNVAKATGPSVHDGTGTDGHHKEIHGFDWEDMGERGLQGAIKYRVNWKVNPSGKAVGMPRGQLYVEPITTRNQYTHTVRKINYGAYLEFGFYPVLMRKVDGEIQKVRGSFTRYPFLSPAMFQAAGGTTGGIIDRFAVAISKELRDMAAVTPGKRKRKRIIEKVPIVDEKTLTIEPLLRKFRNETLEPVSAINVQSYEISREAASNRKKRS